MKIFRFVILATTLAALGCNGQEARTTSNVSTKSRADQIPTRTFMMVEYDYKLEANTSSTTDSEDNIFIDNHPLEDALLDIDTNLIATIQERIPNGEDVQFNSINSRFINMCFTESDACKWVKSRIKFSFLGDRPKPAMERVTLDLVQEYLRDINELSPAVNTMFVYPMFHSSTVQFELAPVDGPMSSIDIEDIEKSFYNVFHAIVAQLDGDTDVSEVYFVYQDVNEPPGGGYGNVLTVNLKYYGKCRYCSEEELTEIVNSSIKSNLKTFLRNIKQGSSTSYFERVEDIVFSLPQAPDGLPPIENPTIFDKEAPEVSKRTPWLLYVGAVVAVAVIATGIIVIARDQKQLRKEDYSTGQESSVFEENKHDGGDADADRNGDDTNDIEQKGSSMAGESLASASNTLNSNGMHNDYEVYVY